MFTNRLINEQSPYLLQHAYNPVDWYPWCDDAFESARQEDKPIFLSIGYSTCHWCHVMAHESFEDEEIARIMNDTFINIKVDREERPDIDSIYMTVCQMLTGSGGWPLTIIMMPDKKPFFSGTYFPKESMYGRIGMRDLIEKISIVWQTSRREILESANSITENLNISPDLKGKAELNSSILDFTFNQIKSQFDKTNGGFGSSPKFPIPHHMYFLLRYWKRAGSKESLDMVEKTLQSMSRGGIYDYVGFGFHRYSTDEKWLVPHFEKMLYDQALLTIAYTEAYQATGKEDYKKTAEEILNYVKRDLTSPEGGFKSAEDADSEGIEGKFYVWKINEIKEILREDTQLFIDFFGIKEQGNFSDGYNVNGIGENIIHQPIPVKEFAEKNHLNPDEFNLKINALKEKLFEVRENRIHPHKDDKILTDWNGLMIAAFAIAGKVFNNSEYINTAQDSADFILSNMEKEDSTLLHRFRNGDAAINGMLEDYAFLIFGLLELYEASFEIKYLRKAVDFTNKIIHSFWDEKSGGFFGTSINHETLIARRKEIYDGALPSGNSIALLNLIRLYKMTGILKYDFYANKLIQAFAGTIEKQPMAYTQFLSAMSFIFDKSLEIVIVGNKSDKQYPEILTAINKTFLPNKVILHKSNDELSELAPFTKDMKSINGKVTVYICRNNTCEQPTTALLQIQKLLSENIN